MTERIPYQPSLSGPSANHPNISTFLPTYLHDAFPDPSGLPDVHIRDELFGATRRKMRIGIIGAGISCLNFLHFARAKFGKEIEKGALLEVVVWEREKDVGGVWLTSKYPGCRCDIPSIVYQFSWRPHIWSEMYAPAAENLEYLQMVAKENDFYRYMNFRHEVEEASWTDEESMWTLRVKDLNSGNVVQEKVNVLLELNGPVNTPRKAPMPGIEDFQGEVIHPALWTDETSVKGKRVCLVGYGCTGVQIGPYIIDQVSQLYTWFRHKTYVLPPPNQHLSAAEGANFKYSEEQKQLLRNDPDLYLAYRKAMEEGAVRRYPYTVNGSHLSQTITAATLQYMTDKFTAANKQSLLPNILPTDFSIGCRRQTYSHGYLESILSPKTTILPSPPLKFTPTGLLTSTNHHIPLDTIIVATGYNASHTPRFPKHINNTPLPTLWPSNSKTPPSYLGLCLLHTPNYFNPSSAYGPLPQGNYYQTSEAYAHYMLAVIDKLSIERILSFRPTEPAVRHFTRHANAFLKRTAVAGNCVGWYRGNEYESYPALWPGGRSQFLRVLGMGPRGEDFEWRYEDEENRFAWFGNGWTVGDDADDGGDKTWYMGRPGREVGQDELGRLRGTDESVTEVVRGMKGDGVDLKE